MGHGLTYWRLHEETDSYSVVNDALSVDKASGFGRRRWVPSPLSRLVGSAFKPEVDDQRVAYLEGTNKGSPSEMTMDELIALAKFFPWPKGVKLKLPHADGGAQARYAGCVVVYEGALKAGFRLPLHPFICDFLFDTNLCPAQLTPNSWRCILAFLLKFKELDLVPSYEAFMYLYNLNRLTHLNGIFSLYFQGVNLIPRKRHAMSWGKRWFLVCQSEEFHFNFPMYPGYCQFRKGYYTTEERKKMGNRVQELIEIFQTQPGKPGQPSYKNLLEERGLEEAGLSLPHPVIGRAGPIGLYDKYITFKRKQEVGCSMEGPSKRQRLVKRNNIHIAHEEEEEEEEDEEEEEEEESEEEEEEEDSEEEEEEDPEEEEVLAHVDGEKEVAEEGAVDASLKGGFGGTSAIDTLRRPEVSMALRQLPEIILAAQRSEELEQQLNESRRENAKLIDELARTRREFEARIEQLEEDNKVAKNKLIDQSLLMNAAQKAKEFLELSSSMLKIKR